MSLINCVECNKEISDKATACPNCGAPVEKKLTTEKAAALQPLPELSALSPDVFERIKKKKKRSITATNIVVIALAIYGISQCSNKEAAENQKSITQKKQLNDGEERLKDALKIRKERVSEFTNNEKEILFDAQAAYNAGSYKVLLDTYEKYRVANSPIMNALLDSAQFEINKVAFVAREKILLAELNNVPASEATENLKRYTELSKMFPENSTYKSKISHYEPGAKLEAELIGLSPKQAALKTVKLNFVWGKTGFDSVMEADFTISNNSKYRIRDIEITCTSSAKSGTEIDRNKKTIYDYVPAGEKKKFGDFNMGFIHSQVEKTYCAVTNLEVEEDFSL